MSHNEESRIRLPGPIADLFIRIDREGAIQDFRPGLDFRRFAPGSKYRGRTLDAILPRGEVAAVREAIGQCLASGRMQARQYGEQVEGTPRRFEIRLWPATSDTAIGLIRDVTSGAPLSASPAASNASSLLQGLLEAGQDGVLVLGATGRIEVYNARFAQLWGLPPFSSSSVDSPALLRLISDQVDRGADLARALGSPDGKPLADRAERLHLSDGRVFECRSSPWTDGGRSAGRIWNFRDVTEYYEAERALRESEQLLAVHLSRTPLAAIAWDPDFFVIEWNPSAERIFGYSREEALGRRGADLIVPPDTHSHVYRVFDDLLRSSENNTSINFNITKDGRRILCEWHNTRIADASGRVLGVASFAQDVTERHQAQEALRLSEERYRELCNALPQTIFELDLNGRVTFVNESAYEMFGYTRADLEAGLIGFDILAPEDRARAMENTRRIAAGEVLRGIEYTALRKDGLRIPVIINGSAITKDGRPIGARGVVTDLTQQKAVEAALESRFNFERLVASLSANFINVPALRIEEELSRALVTLGRWLEADRSYILLLDEARGSLTLGHEFLARGVPSMADLTLPMPASRLPALMRRLAEGSPFLLDSPAELDPSFRSEQRYFEDLGVKSAALVPLLIGGEVYGFVGFDFLGGTRRWPATMALQLKLLGEVFSGALDRKRAEEALISSEIKYRTLLESSGLGVSFVDTEGRYSVINETAASFIGRPAGEIIGRRIQDIFPPERAREFITRFSTVIQSRTSATYEDKLDLPSGVRWFWTIIHPVAEPAGRLLGVQVVSHDISDRKHAEEELGHLEEQLVHSRKMEAIGNLAGGIAHDFNNLLTGVMGYANMLRLRADSPEDVREAAAIIEKTAERASQLTKQLLGFARKGKLQEVPIDVHATVEDVIALLSRTIDKSITIEKRLRADRSVVRGDPTQLQQVVLNLAVNARDAMPGGGRLTFHTGTVEFFAESSWRLTGAPPGAYLLLSVSDTGCGIPEEIRDRVFEPFFTTKATGMGTGMGLATVYGIVKNHGGLVRLSSETGAGTTFKVFLPLPADSSERELAPVVAESPVRGEGCILVVDDEPVVRDLAETMLSDLGYKVLCAVNGREAVDIFRRDPAAIDLVLLDMIMPVMGGRGCLRELKRIDPGVVAVLSTGFSSDGEIQQIMKEGMSGFIQKPYRIEELSRVISAALEAQSRPPAPS